MQTGLFQPSNDDGAPYNGQTSPYAPGNAGSSYGSYGGGGPYNPAIVNTPVIVKPPTPAQTATPPKVTPPPPPVVTTPPVVITPVINVPGATLANPVHAASETGIVATTTPPIQTAGGTPVPTAAAPLFTPPKPNTNTMLYIGIAAVLALYFFSRK